MSSRMDSFKTPTRPTFAALAWSKTCGSVHYEMFRGSAARFEEFTVLDVFYLVGGELHKDPFRFLDLGEIHEYMGPALVGRPLLSEEKERYGGGDGGAAAVDWDSLREENRRLVLGAADGTACSLNVLPTITRTVAENQKL